MDQTIATNRKAFHNFELLDRLEAGLVLTGAEIKAIRAKQVSLAGSFARLAYPREGGNPEAYVVNLHIGTTDEPTRTRKLLLKRIEIGRLIGKLEQKGLTLVPLRLYLKRGRAKLELAVARGATKHDKRERLKRKHRKRQLERESEA